MSEDLILEERALARVSKDEATPDAASWFETVRRETGKE
jgi:hypothetical protein